MPKTLDDVIAKLEELREIHGGNVEVVSSKGTVSFRAFKLLDDPNHHVIVITSDGELL